MNRQITKIRVEKSAAFILMCARNYASTLSSRPGKTRARVAQVVAAAAAAVLAFTAVRNFIIGDKAARARAKPRVIIIASKLPPYLLFPKPNSSGHESSSTVIRARAPLPEKYASQLYTKKKKTRKKDK